MKLSSLLLWAPADRGYLEAAAAAAAEAANWPTAHVTLEPGGAGGAIDLGQRTPLPAIAVFAWRPGLAARIEGALRALRSSGVGGGRVFAVATGAALGSDPALRLRCFGAGAAMVCADLSALPALVARVRSRAYIEPLTTCTSLPTVRPLC